MSVQVVRNIRAERELEQIFKDAAIDAGYFSGYSEGGETLASIAAKNEVTRPFMSRAAEKTEREIPDLYKMEIRKAGFDSKKFIKLAGLKAVALIKKEIDTSPSWAEPNSDYTIAQKGSSHPLIDTGKMRNNADYRLAK